MSETDSLKQILGKLVQVVELLADETAELVDKYYRPSTLPEYQHELVGRSSALLAASQELRLAAEKVLDKTDLPSLVQR